jgi:geranylgeranyl pyrophosphate synthase
MTEDYSTSIQSSRAIVRDMDLVDLFGLSTLDEHIHAVNEKIEQGVRDRNPRLGGPSLRQAHGGGKRIRPALAIAAAAVGGSEISQDVLAGAAAVELVHTGSLVHDDIIDRADVRRGVITINRREGNDVAILAGDYLLGLSGEFAASVSREVAAVLARTIISLCAGQMEELSDTYNLDRTEQSLFLAIEGKTAALMQAACEIGALAARLSTPQVDALAEYGHEFGVAFQIVDDVLDLVSSEERFGKPVHNDLRCGVYTLPVLYALQSDEGALLKDELMNPITGLGHDLVNVEAAIALVHKGDYLQRSIAKAERHASAAHAALVNASLDRSVVGQKLAVLPHRYIVEQIAEKAVTYEFALSER